MATSSVMQLTTKPMHNLAPASVESTESSSAQDSTTQPDAPLIPLVSAPLIQLASAPLSQVVSTKMVT